MEDRINSLIVKCGMWREVLGASRGALHQGVTTPNKAPAMGDEFGTTLGITWEFVTG